MAKKRPPKRRCAGTCKKTGLPCGNAPIRGGTVCTYHGAGAPQVKKKAKERLEELVDPAITRLVQLVEQTDNPSVALGAVRDALDRAGLVKVEKVEVTNYVYAWDESDDKDDAA